MSGKQGPPQNKEAFDAMYEQLTPRNKEILLHFLNGYEDKEIAKMIFGTCDNVKFHISRVARIFGLVEKPEPGEKRKRESHRKDIVDLFVQYRPSAVSEKRKIWAGYKPQAPLKSSPAVVPDVPGRPMALNSLFYLQPSLADRCYEEVLRSGQLIRIRAPQMFGKTSLLYRILDTAQKEGYKTISLNLRYDLDESAVGSLAALLTWFCQEVATYLELPIDNLPTTKAACNTFFQKQILPNVEVPLVIALDEVEVLFEYPAIAEEFFAMLRGWHEKATGISATWKKLRLVIVHSTDAYIKLDRAKSPFTNVGHVAWPQPLQLEQVKTLADSYGLQESMNDVIESLMLLVEGHPYLIQHGLYALCCGDTTGQDLLSNAATSSGIYRGHFQDLAVKLKSTIGQSADLVKALRQVLQDPENAKLSPEEIFKLEGLGLVRPKNNQAYISCDLYQRYFSSVALN
jgi:DNA-binding CsgD family transcriptional regulator